MKRLIYTRDNQVFRTDSFNIKDDFVSFIGYELTNRDKRFYKIPVSNISKIVEDEIKD